MADDGAGNDDKAKSGGKGALRDLAKAESMIQLALAVPVGCFVGLLLGAWLDRHFHQHWMSVAGMLLGAAGGFIQIFTTVARLPKRGE
jgi:ATP synthase protein I